MGSTITGFLNLFLIRCSKSPPKSFPRFPSFPGTDGDLAGPFLTRPRLYPRPRNPAPPPSLTQRPWSRPMLPLWGLGPATVADPQ